MGPSTLSNLQNAINEAQPIKVLILGLGSVGTYLLDYLVTFAAEEKAINLHLVAAGRNQENLQGNINIIRVANAIRHGISENVAFQVVDLEDVDEIAQLLESQNPHIIVNTSRVCSGIKYGRLSWNTVRAYGLWAPLAIKYIRNLMLAYKQTSSTSIVINSSYPDVTNPWIKEAGLPCPGFGSGNLNHLVPRIKFAIACMYNLESTEGIEVILSTSHYHDVLISTEGRIGGTYPLVHISHNGKKLSPNMDRVYKHCAIPMPTDSKRNMMNASSNFEIITKILQWTNERKITFMHIPGFGGMLGGYPVKIDEAHLGVVDEYWHVQEMVEHNRQSIHGDGIEDVLPGGVLVYTGELIDKVKRHFAVELPKCVEFKDIDAIGQHLIDAIIERNH